MCGVAFKLNENEETQTDKNEQDENCSLKFWLKFKSLPRKKKTLGAEKREIKKTEEKKASSIKY